MPQHPLDLGQEAHVGHAVGFVDHERLDLVEVELVALEQVDQPARCAHRDFDAAAQVADLPFHRRAAVERGDPDAGLLGERLQDVDDLLGELTGRDEHECGRVARARGLEPLQHRQPEGEGLARSGLRFAAHVVAGERVFDGGLLDRKGVVDALGREGVDELGLQAEIRERLHLMFLSHVGCGLAPSRWLHTTIEGNGRKSGE